MPSACTADPACTGVWKLFVGRRSACTPSPRRREGPAVERVVADIPPADALSRGARVHRVLPAGQRGGGTTARARSARRLARAGTCRRRSGTRSRSPRSSRRIRPRRSDARWSSTSGGSAICSTGSMIRGARGRVRDERLRRLAEEITSLWLTDPVRRAAPTPLDEVRATMALFDRTIFTTLPKRRANRGQRRALPMGHLGRWRSRRQPRRHGGCDRWRRRRSPTTTSCAGTRPPPGGSRARSRPAIWTSPRRRRCGAPWRETPASSPIEPGSCREPCPTRRIAGGSP